ncbi:enoyl-CoA hydratase [Microvirga lotononidis]|uniref:Enoyl-CoA hydratase domain-containing protein 3, mitochondrial n=1 Tax=Microvirga lotononidis TaxID=864069 RepID=I4YVB8_9HYPH|nr:enoyl-CoA hydratase [Microvirga lotononidis]EIM27910.1 enoyl-CoA hydratase/carnithine racemase [Microvirga lotononidis]WQO27965.1 enoyl-CoA hydratase [Microvirga lotononidis]
MSAQQAVSSNDILLRDERDGVVTLTLNRPAQFNALSEEMLSALQQALDDLRDDEAVRCVVLAASGKAFCAGHDLKQMRANPRQEYYQALFAQCSRVMQGIVKLPVPVIARVHGMATAAGCQLVASCDLAVAAESATFAVSGINVGLFCSTPAVALSRNITPKHAFDMLVTGRFISSSEALSFGLISRVAPDAELDDAVAALTAEICAKSPVAIRTGKAMFGRQRSMSLEEAYAYAGDVMACNMMADDAAEGIDAFIEKRKPVWKGR